LRKNAGRALFLDWNKGEDSPFWKEEGGILQSSREHHPCDLMITVRVRTILSIRRALGKGEFDFSLSEENTLNDLLSLMISKWGDKLSSHLLRRDSNGRTQQIPITRIMINGRDIEFLNGLETELHEGDEVLILPVVSGG
jgi:molybdopterin synthase sulfur carrier subunit